MIENKIILDLRTRVILKKLLSLVRKHDKWFSHLSSEHFIKKIKRKEHL